MTISLWRSWSLPTGAATRPAPVISRVREGALAISTSCPAAMRAQASGTIV